MNNSMSIREVLYYPGNYLDGPLLSAAFSCFDRTGRLAPDEDYDCRRTYRVMEPYQGFASPGEVESSFFIDRYSLEQHYDVRIEKGNSGQEGTEEGRKRGIIRNVVPTKQESELACDRFERYINNIRANEEYYKRFLGDEFRAYWEDREMPMPIYGAGRKTNLLTFLEQKCGGKVGMKMPGDRPGMLVCVQVWEIYFTILVETIVQLRGGLCAITDHVDINKYAYLPSEISAFKRKAPGRQLSVFFKVLFPETNDIEALWKIRTKNEKRRISFMSQLKEFIDNVSKLDRPNELPDAVGPFHDFLEEQKEPYQRQIKTAGLGVGVATLGLFMLVYDWEDLDLIKKAIGTIETAFGGIITVRSLQDINREVKEAEKYLTLLELVKRT